MKKEREELIDFLLGELPAEEARTVAGRISENPSTASERDELVQAIGLLRAAAAQGWEAKPAARLRWLRPPSSRRRPHRPRSRRLCERGVRPDAPPRPGSERRVEFANPSPPGTPAE